ncbi:MerR family transcriptional regulator [Konateibacter massiliensis]|uniref:MerR family transcriptional regulator n=1 Tax=Konateibacter massiliensis TaxID=2002841 RepID=UPI0015D49A91|nr:MerR family transcriptional regulator [Konateibacter massiliensis]
MKINEVSKLTQLSQKTIRYYEERGLISPDMKVIRGRNFRNYSDATVNRLMSIATLRRLFFTIEDIKILLEKPEQINSLLRDYESRLSEEITEKNNILNTLADLKNQTSITNIDSLSAALSHISADYELPAADINPDFSHMDPEEPEYDNKKEHRIHTRFSFLAKKANAAEMFILELLWKNEAMSFNTIVHKCMEHGVFSDSDLAHKALKRMCRRKLVSYGNGVYTPRVNATDIEFRNFDFMVQTAYNGSPSKMIYTPPSTPTGFGDGK